MIKITTPENATHDQIWFTADLHLMHARIIELCRRPFADLGDMHAQIVDNFNQSISPNDVVYVLGDTFLVRDNIRAALDDIGSILSTINGQLNFILGNHDDRGKLTIVVNEVNRKVGYNKLRVIVDDRVCLSVPDPQAFNGHQKIILDHYPLRAWDGAHRGSWHLYGHVHACRKFVSDDQNFGYTTDVGIDACNYHPVAYSYIKKLFATYNQNPNLGQKQSVWLPNSARQA